MDHLPDGHATPTELFAGSLMALALISAVLTFHADHMSRPHERAQNVALRLEALGSIAIAAAFLLVVAVTFGLLQLNSRERRWRVFRARPV
jgi:nitrate reductase gamma subunit